MFIVLQGEILIDFHCYRFTAFVTKYNLMSKDNLIVPIMEGEGATESEA